MKGVTTKKNLVLWTVLSLFGYYLYRPIPDGVDEPFKAWQIVNLLSVTADFAFLLERLGLASAIDTYRLLTDGSSATFRYRGYTSLQISDTEFNGVKVRVYDPRNKTFNGPGLMFFHGGGWLFGSIETHDHIALDLAEKLQMVVVSVDYRRSPEHPYPIPMEDCLNATLYFMQNAEKFSVDPQRIGIIGDSAGGNLAAAVTLKLRQRSDVSQPRLQILAYPAMQMVDLDLPSYRKYDGTMYFTKEVLAGSMLYYLGHDLTHLREVMSNQHTSAQMRAEFRDLWSRLLPSRDSDSPINVTAQSENASTRTNWELTERLKPFVTDPFFMPLMAKKMTGLPKAYVLTAEYDVLRDDGILYAKRLEEDGVRVTWEHHQGAYHGFLGFIRQPMKTELGLRSMDNLVHYLKAEL